MNDQRFYSLIELKAAADEICAGLNMKCGEARQWMNEDGDRGYSVHIADASTLELQDFIGDELSKRGFSCVDVLTER